MTAEQANEALMQKRESEPQAPLRTNGDILASLGRLKVISDREADSLRRAQPENRAESHLMRLSANIPQRHAKNDEMDRSGDWGRIEKALLSKLGAGFLIALVGRRGCGKTQLGVELINRTLSNGKSALFSSVTRLFMEIKSTYRKESKESEADVLLRYTKPKMLVLDELGRRSESDWENRILFELLNDRYNAERDTLLIGNETKEEFQTQVGDSLVSRIRETGGLIDCTWESFRK